MLALMTQNKPDLISNTRTYRAYLGGSFNPIHLGHIQMAMAVKKCLALHTHHFVVSLMPSHNPFKTYAIDNVHRLAMLDLASRDFNLAIETCELKNTPTYTIDTLKALKKHHPNDTLIFIVGQDSLESLPTWKAGSAILDYAHLWVFNRDTDNQDLPCFIKQNLTDKIDDLLQLTNGRIYQDKTAISDISSSSIRHAIAQKSPICHLTLQGVAGYITQHKLYR